MVRHPFVVARVDLLKIPPKSGLEDSTLTDPDVNPTPPKESTEVVIYGAKRRGAHGVVVIAGSNFRGAYSRLGDIGITSKKRNWGICLLWYGEPDRSWGLWGSLSGSH